VAEGDTGWIGVEVGVEDTGGLFSVVVESCTLVGLDGINVGATNCVGEKFKSDNNLLCWRIALLKEIFVASPKLNSYAV
jgi:hypothetical protein